MQRFFYGLLSRMRFLAGVPLLLLALPAAGQSGPAVMACGGGAASAGPYAVVDTTGQPVLGVASGDTESEAGGFWQGCFASPIVPAIDITVRAGRSVVLPFLSVLATATDEDGDAVRVAAADALSTRGFPVRMGGDSFEYPALTAQRGVDAFSFLIVDSGGDVSTGTVRIDILPDIGIVIMLVQLDQALFKWGPWLLPADNVAVPQTVEELGCGQHEHVIKQGPPRTQIDAKRMHRRRGELLA